MIRPMRAPALLAKSCVIFTALSLATAIQGASALAAELNATLNWAQPTALGLAVSGVIDRVEVQAGQRVKQGDLLLALNPTLFNARVLEARADADRATEDEADARRDLDRANELYARTVTSTTELDAARLRQARAKAGLDAAQARLEQARRVLAESELRAPFDGIVLDRKAEPGMVVAAQCQPPVLITLAHADQLVAQVRLDADQAAGLQPGGKARVTAAGQTLEGRVTALSYAEEGYRLEITLPRGDGLRPGQAASIDLKP